MLSCVHAQQPQPVSNTSVIIDQPLRTGADSIVNNYHVQGDCFGATVPLILAGDVAVVANQTSVISRDGKLVHLVDTLLSLGVHVNKIFCPEHGFRGNTEAGARVDNSVDSKTGLPIVSLYGKNKKPTSEQMKGIDLVIFDLQDVGCRFYTYISTLHYVMEACAEAGVPLIVLDRPNPNCHYVDGPVLDTSKYRSFVGMHPVPVVYGMTIGEYAQMINGEHWLKGSIQCDLTVVPMQGYRRDSSYVLPVPPSPNLQTPQSILLYPSLCLFEGTNISVGRGTDTPFELIGAPNCDIGGCLNSTFTVGEQQVPVCVFKPHYIKGVSENPPFKDKQCYGLKLSNVKVAAKFDLAWLMQMYWMTPHDTFFQKNNLFEKLAGTDRLRKQIMQGLSEEEIRASWEPALSHYKQIRKKYLLYPDVEQR